MYLCSGGVWSYSYNTMQWHPPNKNILDFFPSLFLYLGAIKFCLSLPQKVSPRKSVALSKRRYFNIWKHVRFIMDNKDFTVIIQKNKLSFRFFLHLHNTKKCTWWNNVFNEWGYCSLRSIKITHNISNTIYQF